MRPADHPVAVPTIVAAMALSWLGLVIHNLAELPGQARLGPATLPSVAYLLLAAGWLSPGRGVAAWLLLGWGWLHAIGGGLLSVLPLPLWPYQPEQSLRHYAVHALYALLQVPLLITATRHLHHPEPAGELTPAEHGAPTPAGRRDPTRWPMAIRRAGVLTRTPKPPATPSGLDGPTCGRRCSTTLLLLLAPPVPGKASGLVHIEHRNRE